MDIKDRFKMIRDYSGMGQNKFESHIGISTGYFFKVKGSVGSDILFKISEKFPEINIDWIVTGKGEMLKADYKDRNDNSGIINTGKMESQNNAGTVLGHNIQISDPSKGGKKMMKSEGFEMSYESLPENYPQHTIEILNQKVSHLESALESKDQIIASKNSENEVLKGRIEDLNKIISIYESGK